MADADVLDSLHSGAGVAAATLAGPCGQPSATVNYYRIYLLDSANHICAHHTLGCERDEDAVTEAAFLLRNYSSVEVWSGARMVRRLTALT